MSDRLQALEYLMNQCTPREIYIVAESVIIKQVSNDIIEMCIELLVHEYCKTHELTEDEREEMADFLDEKFSYEIVEANYDNITEAAQKIMENKGYFEVNKNISFTCPITDEMVLEVMD